MPGAVKFEPHFHDLRHEAISRFFEHRLILARPKGPESPACNIRELDPRGSSWLPGVASRRAIGLLGCILGSRSTDKSFEPLIGSAFHDHPPPASAHKIATVWNTQLPLVDQIDQGLRN